MPSAPHHEFDVTIRRIDDPATSTPQLRIAVTSVRDFSSFGYALNVTDRSAVADQRIAIEIGGLGLTRNTMPAAGKAAGSVDLPMPSDGTYTFVIKRRTAMLEVALVIEHGNLKLMSPPSHDFAIVSVA